MLAEEARSTFAEKAPPYISKAADEAISNMMFCEYDIADP